ncbi:hypothetical protein JCM19232_3222 [Vibrio ishigakensis]|uniref:NIPSNAP domain-containing protein n=1 Tax=Vibrio ishigakensis TaxID=1481914 RepID=A0A0B8PQI5_9VIBR|nr:hypothetical protein JCM19232_3222 [Vibrio ishigakensis]
MIVELREYKLRPGKAQAWLEWMKQDVIPYQISKGMRVIDTYIYQDESGDTWFVWLREFDNQEQKAEVYANTYDEYWIEYYRPKIFQHIYQDSIRVRELSPANLT